MATVDSDDDVRVIETGTPLTRYARGRRCPGMADTFRDGKPHAVQAFGTKLVVFADNTGKLNILNGYCPHMAGARGPLADPERTANVQPLVCQSRATAVLVRKSSLAQTSMQWPDSAEGSAEFTEAIATRGRPRTPVIPTCTWLRATIERTLRNGALAVVDA
ncbi:Rieske 2Fe-2S domain-containing protein [Streptomyces sp. NPDC088551]|uniref:Rieske 2Fe-2S domain-containing protein n=1 Tax=Streptomyces sp. NPDC088551 TaxID=3365863 RepID=UPI00381CACF2